MPPKGRPAPSPEEIAAVTEWFDGQFARLDRSMKPDPGRVTARRLNRAEYNNTIRDLLGIDFKPAADFPADDSGYGFDNIGDVLSLSPVLMEKYLTAAERVARKAVANRRPSRRARKSNMLQPVSNSTRRAISIPATRSRSKRIMICGWPWAGVTSRYC